MTENEAIEVLKDFDKQAAAKADGAYQTAIGEIACKVAISALEEKIKRNEFFNFDSPVDQTDYKELIRYKALGTVEELREAEEKQRAKKPYIETEKATGLHEDYDCYECPNCDSFLGHVSDCKDKHYRYDYCPNCGQAIDWSEAEE